MSDGKIVKMRVVGTGLTISGVKYKIGDIVEVPETVAEYLNSNRPQLASKDLSQETSFNKVKEIKKTKDKELKFSGTKTKELIK